MTTHIMAMTYKPKIEAVFNGECGQTIRKYNPFNIKQPGDKLIVHTWEGKPYRSKWGKRLETEIAEVKSRRLYWQWKKDEEKPGHYMWDFSGCVWHRLDEDDLRILAERDHIAKNEGQKTPVGWTNLMLVLAQLNGGSLANSEWDVIRWVTQSKQLNDMEVK